MVLIIFEIKGARNEYAPKFNCMTQARTQNFCLGGGGQLHKEYDELILNQRFHTLNLL